MEVPGTSFVKFLGYKRRSKMHEIEGPKIRKECFLLSELTTQNTYSSAENEMEIDSVDGDSLFIQLENGDYSLNSGKIPKNNSFIIPDYLKENNNSDIFKGWKYIDFIYYFRDQCDTRYYDYYCD